MMGWGNWGNMMGGWGNGGYGGGYGWMGMMMPLIFGIGIILLVLFVFRRRNTSQVHTNGHGKQNSGLDILHERYARGEIDSTEYQSRKQDLEGK